MKEYEEDNLVNFFRNRAEGDQYDFREEDWVKMEAKLDAAEAASGFVFGKYFWIAVGVLLSSLLFLTYLQLIDPSDSEKVTVNTQTLETLLPSEKKIISEDINNQDRAVSSVETNPESTAKIPVSEHGPESLKAKGATNKSKQLIAKNTINEKHQNTARGINKNSYSKVDPTAVWGSLSNNTPTDGQLVSNQAIIPALIMPIMPESTEQDIDVLPDYDRSQQIKIIIPTQEEIVTKRFYTLGLVGGLDISTTKASEWGKPVLRLGISGEYFITERLSIGVGVNLSEKKYSAKGREYSPPKGFWTNGVVPDSTNAICRILDVPVTLSYYLPVSKKGSIVFHGGLSSWFLLKENYWYKYASKDPDLVSWWGGNNENQYWFGILNVAVSYEYILNNKWSLLVGPYANFPLTGVGHGKVELRSFGLRTGIRLNKYKLRGNK